MERGRLGKDCGENDFRGLSWCLFPPQQQCNGLFLMPPVDGAEILPELWDRSAECVHLCVHLCMCAARV